MRNACTQLAAQLINQGSGEKAIDDDALTACLAAKRGCCCCCCWCAGYESGGESTAIRSFLSMYGTWMNNRRYCCNVRRI